MAKKIAKKCAYVVGYQAVEWGEKIDKEVAAEMNINETGLHDRFKRGFVNINDLIKLLDSLDMDLIIRDRRYNR